RGRRAAGRRGAGPPPCPPSPCWTGKRPVPRRSGPSPRHSIRVVESSSCPSFRSCLATSVLPAISLRRLTRLQRRRQRPRVGQPVIVADLDQRRGGQTAAADQFLAVGERHHVVGPAVQEEVLHGVVIARCGRPGWACLSSEEYLGRACPGGRSLPKMTR